MTHVFVNGVQVLKAVNTPGATPGRFVRGPGYRRRIVAASYVKRKKGVRPHFYLSRNHICRAG